MTLKSFKISFLDFRKVLKYDSVEFCLKMTGRIFIQNDWNQSIREKGEKTWVSFKVEGSNSVQGNLASNGLNEQGKAVISASSGFEIVQLSKRSIFIQYVSNGFNVARQFFSPSQTFSMHQKAVRSLDTTQGGLGASTDDEERLLIWTTENGDIRRTLNQKDGHFGDINDCKFFPSGIVLLTAGSDTQLKIWSVGDGRCGATLIGHRAGVLDTAIVERGKNIVSSSRDGTVKLWHVGTQTVIHSFEPEGGCINCCSIYGQTSENLSKDGKEFGTEGKFTFVGGENGKLVGYNLFEREKIFDKQHDSPLNCIANFNEKILCCGFQSGKILCYDLRQLNNPIYKIDDGRGAILSCKLHSKNMFFSCSDGSVFGINNQFENIAELTGSDCDPIYSLSSDDTYLYASCRDGCIRKYQL